MITKYLVLLSQPNKSIEVLGVFQNNKAARKYMKIMHKEYGKFISMEVVTSEISEFGEL